MPDPPTKIKTKKRRTYKYFIPQARLNRGQRRYCHCLMKARTQKNNPYKFCTNIANRDKNLAKVIEPRNYGKQLLFDIKQTNCVMNYAYDDYTIEEIKAFMAEKGLPTYQILSNGKRKQYPKDRLVQILIQNYIKTHVKSKTVKK